MKLHEKGDIECPECKGLGDLGYTQEVCEIKTSRGHIIKVPGKKMLHICNKCQGTGKLDWIEAVVGKKDNNFFEYISDMVNWKH